MSDTSSVLVALSTAPDEASARRLARELLEARLVACATLLPGAVSMYWWRGAIEESAEWLLLLKTSAERWPALLERLPGLHPYEVPELLALPVAAGLEPYLKWLVTQTQGDPR